MCNPLLCHHVFLCRPDNPRLVSQVPVTIQVLDVNDNAPAIAGDSDDIIVCESSRAGQVRCAHSFKIKNNVSLSRLLSLLLSLLPSTCLTLPLSHSHKLLHRLLHPFVCLTPSGRDLSAELQTLQPLEPINYSACIRVFTSR